MDRQFLSIRQAAEFSSLSSRLLYDLCRNRKIRYFKVRGRIVLDSKDVEDFIREEAVEPIDWDKKAEELVR